MGASILPAATADHALAHASGSECLKLARAGVKKPKAFKDSTLGLFNRLIFDLVLLAGNVPVFAAKKKQRFPALNFRVLDFANDNRVISGGMSCNDAAT